MKYYELLGYLYRQPGDIKSLEVYVPIGTWKSALYPESTINQAVEISAGQADELKRTVDAEYRDLRQQES